MSKKLLILALLVGLFFRGFQLVDRFMYGHDNDLASWIVKDIVIDGHLRLIGQETSAKGIFIGPLWYYSMIPFYAMTGMDPVGSLYSSLIIGLFSIFSLYYVVNKLHGSKSGGIAALIYAGSFLISQTEREVVPTTPVMLWTVWFYYSVNLVFQGKKSGLLLAAILVGLVWHMNLALILLAPLIILGVFFKIKNFSLKDFALPAIILAVMMVPLFIFEFRHGFIQSKALFGSVSKLSEKQDDSGRTFGEKVTHVVSYAQKNATKIFFVPDFEMSYSWIPGLLIIGFVALLLFRKVPSYLGLVFPVWMSFYVLFFTLHPINLSEYYLNGMNIFWIIIAGLVLGKLTPRLVAATVLCFLLSYNLYSFLSSPVNASGYVARKQLVAFIAEDAKKHNYPCVSVSYITNPGYELGYRYLFFREGMRVNQPKSGSPVYSIVFPHSLVDSLDKTFGALGLVLPSYSRYDQDTVSQSCSGENANLTDPMFGFTK